MSWHFLERWLERANQHSTLIGKFWITYLIVCRMVIIGSIGDRVYADEQSEFRCNTQQPGCVQVCYNKFAPISHVRFWGFQLMCVTMPSVGFIVYSGHKAKEKMRVDQSKKQEAKAQLIAEKKSERAVSTSGSVLPGTKAPSNMKEAQTQTHRQTDDDSDSSGNKSYHNRRSRNHRKDGQHERISRKHQKSPPQYEKEVEYDMPPPLVQTGKGSDLQNQEQPVVQALIDSSKITKESKEESKKKCGIMVGKSVSQHFHLYMANVFFRLASEATFGILQLWLFGYKVKELFKCQGFPCPHVVDCFISRPAEKTIFLNFMLGFTIFCVILNLMEFKYLCFLFFKARVKLTAKRSHPILPKPSSFRNFPAYEPLGKPLGFDMPDPRPLNQSPKGQNQLGLAPPPPMHPQSYVDVDAAAASTFGNGHFATSAGDAEKRESRWNLPKKKS